MKATSLAAAAAVSLTGAVVIPLDRPGIGWAIAGLVPLALVRKDHRAAWALLAAALLGTGALRSAGWLFALCAVGALLLTAVAVVNGRSWSELVLALPTWIRRAFQAFPAIGAATDRHGAVRLARGLGMGLVLVVVFGLLLGSAEQRFADLLQPMMSWPRLVVFAGLALLCLGAAHRPAGQEQAQPVPPKKAWGTMEWAIPVALVNALFLVFAIVQSTVLFGGHDHVLDPNGPTYAQYARGGFTQLATVAVLTLGVVAAVLARVAERDRLLARVLVGLLCGLTLVIVGSALRRMQLYVEAFGFTRTRLLATVAIIWIGLILLLLLAVWNRAILPRLSLAAGALLLLAVSALNPDRIIAETVIERWDRDGHLDAPYVASLSPDALPALAALPEPKRSCIAGAIVRAHLRGNRSGKDAWNGWNAARAAASGRRGEMTPECAFYLDGGYRMEGNWTDPSQLTRQ